MPSPRDKPEASRHDPSAACMRRPLTYIFLYFCREFRPWLLLHWSSRFSSRSLEVWIAAVTDVKVQCGIPFVDVQCKALHMSREINLSQPFQKVQNFLWIRPATLHNLKKCDYFLKERNTAKSSEIVNWVATWTEHNVLHFLLLASGSKLYVIRTTESWTLSVLYF